MPDLLALTIFFGDPPSLTSGFRFGGPVLWHRRARLYPDRIELTGWRLQGRYRRRIPLAQILQVDVPAPEELLLWLADGQALRLGMPRPGLWKARLDGLLALPPPPPAPNP